MVNRPLETNSFEFIAVAALRTKQLMRGCLARVPSDHHKLTTTAQMEVVAGKVFKLPDEPKPAPQPVSEREFV